LRVAERTADEQADRPEIGAERRLAVRLAARLSGLDFLD